MSRIKFLIPVLCVLFLLTCKSKNPVSQTDSPIKENLKEVYNNNRLTPAEKMEGWTLLFDGRNADQWRGYNQTSFPKSGWAIDKQGHLTVSYSGKGEAGDGGSLITKEKFENFEFRTDFKVSEKGNSGILYRVKEVPDNEIWFLAPEYQILDNQHYIKELGDMASRLTAECYDLYASDGDYTKPVGEWNTAEIIVDDNYVEHWLNGKRVVAYTIGSEDWRERYEKSKFSKYDGFGLTLKGHIGLQDHGELIQFKNIKVRKLPGSRSPIFNRKNLDGWTIYGTEKWYVKDGELICESGPDKQYGYLATDKKYKNFDLTVDFLQEAEGNSGVFFRSDIEGTKITGWQAEVAPPGNNTGGIYESYGRGWLIKPNPSHDKALKMGDWNTMRIRVNDDRVTTWLNGKLMIDFQDAKIGDATGKIALQIHDGGGIKVRWKNIKIKEL